MSLKKIIGGLGLLASVLTSLSTHAAPNPTAYIPFPPFHIVGNLYYVGSQELASYLLATPKGLILINSSFKDSPPLIKKSVEQLGFKFGDIKVLLISHAHNDHAAGSAQIIKETHARYEVMDADVNVIESGGKTDYFYGDNPDEQYPPAHVDRTLHDGDTVELGGTVLTAHLTPGHTKGNTTWTFDEKEDGKTLHIVIVGSTLMNRGMDIVDNPKYPQIIDDYEKGFAVLKSLPCDIFLGAHGRYFDLQDKYKKWEAGDKSVFIDPAGYRAFIDQSQKSFEAEVKKQQQISRIFQAEVPLGSQEWRVQRLAQSHRTHELVKLPAGDRTLQAFVAYPDSKDPVPVVVMIPEDQGLNDWARDMADQIAAMGYIIITPDLLAGFGPNGGGITSFRNKARAMEALTARKDDSMIEDLNAWADYGKKLSQSNGKLAVIGFAWGGGRAFWFATQRKDLSAAFIFYDSAPPASALAGLTAPVYALYAENDPRVTKSLPVTKAAMAAAGKKYEPIMYPGSQHMFVRLGEEPGNSNPANIEARNQALMRLEALLKSM